MSTPSMIRTCAIPDKYKSHPYTDGGLTVSEEMRQLTSTPGYITKDQGGQRFRDLYADGKPQFY